MVDDSFIGTLTELMDSLTTGTPLALSGRLRRRRRDNLASVAMYEAALRSAREKRPVSIAEIEGEAS
jgi:hypothetical protein